MPPNLLTNSIGNSSNHDEHAVTFTVYSTLYLSSVGTGAYFTASICGAPLRILARALTANMISTITFRHVPHFPESYARTGKRGIPSHSFS